jgi:hypothetical protein
MIGGVDRVISQRGDMAGIGASAGVLRSWLLTPNCYEIAPERGSGRCTCARGEGRDQNRVAGDLVVVGINDEGRRLPPNPTSDFVVLVLF